MTNVNRESLFFATSFSGHVDYETMQVHDDFRARIEEILGALRQIGGFSVECAVESEGWRISELPPGESMAANFAKIEAADTFLALVDTKGSDGRGIEVEHAYNAGKRVILATGPEEKLGWVMGELVALNRAIHIPYQTPADLTQQIKAALLV